jgi:hypothetical protein
MIRIAVLFTALALLRAVEALPILATQTHAFGSTYPHTVCEHDFVFRNPGPTAWTVRKAVTSCACSVPRALPTTVAAGSDLVVPVRFQVGGRREGAAGGEINVVVAVAGTEQRVQCRFTAQVASLLRLPEDQARMDPLDLQVGDPPVTSSCVIRRGAHPAPWDRLQAEVIAGSEMITVQVAPVADTPQAWQVAWTVAPGALAGSIPGRIDLTCWNGAERLPQTERLTVPVRVRGPVRADPDSLVFGAFPVGMNETRPVRIVDGQDNPVAVLECRASDPARCTATVTAAGIAMTYTAVAPVGPAPGWLDVRTAQGTVRLPYLAAVARP